MILTWKPNQLFCLFCEESGVNMPSQAVYRHVCKHHQIIIITLSALVFKQLTKYFDKELLTRGVFNFSKRAKAQYVTELVPTMVKMVIFTQNHLFSGMSEMTKYDHWK